jgi:hypothetical protein
VAAGIGRAYLHRKSGHSALLDQRLLDELPCPFVVT